MDNLVEDTKGKANRSARNVTALLSELMELLPRESIDRLKGLLKATTNARVEAGKLKVEIESEKLKLSTLERKVAINRRKLQEIVGSERIQVSDRKSLRDRLKEETSLMRLGLFLSLHDLSSYTPTLQ
jgi:hypothetical protein